MPFETLRNITIPALPNFVSDGLLPEGGRLIIGGRAKVGKSYLALEHSTSLAMGTPFMGLFRQRSRTVALIQAEMPPALFLSVRIAPLKSYMHNNGAMEKFYLEQTKDFRLSDTQAVRRLMTETDKIKPDLLTIDPLYAIHTGSFNSADAVVESLHTLDYIAAPTKSAIELVAHFRKSSRTSSGKSIQQGMEDILGSSLFYGWADSIITVTPLCEDDEEDVFPTRKISFWTRWLPPLGDMEADLHPYPPFFVVRSLSPKLRILMEINKGLSNNPNTVARRAKVNPVLARKFLNSLVSAGMLKIMGGEYVFRS